MTHVRRADRAITDRHKIERILSQAKIVHLGLVDAGRPYVVPLHYCYEYSANALTLYMHSAREGRKLDVIAASPTCFVELECDVDLDDGGEAPYEIPCRYGSFYSSVMGDGTAGIVTDPAEKIHALELLMEQQSGRQFAITAPMAESVAVIKVVVPADRLTAKAHVRG